MDKNCRQEFSDQCHRLPGCTCSRAPIIEHLLADARKVALMTPVLHRAHLLVIDLVSVRRA